MLTKEAQPRTFYQEPLPDPLIEKETRRHPLYKAARAIDAVIAYRLAFGHIPGGVAYGIVNRDGIVTTKGHGFADRESGRLMTDTTLLRINSVTKFLFTATAIMQLTEQGKIDLDDKLLSYFPEFKSDATIKQVLSQKAGIMSEDGNHWEDGDFYKTKQGLRRKIRATDTTIFEPGIKYHYSNLGFALLGDIIKLASGKTYEQYVRDHIIDPLGLQDTHFDLTDEVRRELATGYGIEELGAEREIFSPNKDTGMQEYNSAAGGITSIRDLCILLAAHFPNNEILLSDDSKNQMHTVSISDTTDKYGFGVQIDEDKNSGRVLIGHGGTGRGFTSKIGFDKNQKIGTAVVMNTRDRVVFAKEIEDTIWQFIDYFTKHEDRFNKSKPIQDSKQYEGLFKSISCHTQILPINDQLFSFVQTHHGKVVDFFQLIQVGKGKFQADPEADSIFAGEIFTFNKNAKGEVIGMQSPYGYVKKFVLIDDKAVYVSQEK